MNTQRSRASSMAARWGNTGSTIARSYGSKNGLLPLRTTRLNNGSFPRKNAHAPTFIPNKRLLSTLTTPEHSTVGKQLPDHLKGVSAGSKPAALKALASGYLLLAPNDEAFTHYYKFGNFFLRENCQCPKCVHPDTKQRIVEIGSILPDIAPKKIHCGNLKEGAQITWNDGHESTYSWSWLSNHKVVHHKPRNYMSLGPTRDLIPRKGYWSVRPSDPSTYPEVEFKKVMSDDAAVLDWLWKIQKYGFSFIKGVPIEPESTKTLIERIAFVRHTHYGGFWDFTADLTFKDTAYTNESLGVHTDNTYFTDPARLQLFHLLSHTDGSGGESLLADGFYAAQTLHRKYPEYFRLLAQVRHPWHASGNDDVCIQPSFMNPVFSIHQDRGDLYQIRWNNYDRAPKSNWSVGLQQKWYMAAQCYDDILNKPSRIIQTQLEPGTALIFDNWRMMHGRTAFTGKRRMCGGYVNNDDYISRLRMLKFGREHILDRLGSHTDNPGDQGPYSII